MKYSLASRLWFGNVRDENEIILLPDTPDTPDAGRIPENQL